MIHLEVQDYCHDCMEFEPVKKEEISVDTFAGRHKVDTVVRCEYAERCRRIAEKMENGNDATVEEEAEVEMNADIDFDTTVFADMFRESITALKKMMKCIEKDS